MFRIVTHSRRLGIGILHVTEQRVLERPSPGVVCELEPAPITDPVAVDVQRDDRIRDVAGRDRDRQDVDSDPLRVQDHREPPRDVEIDVELGHALPGSAGLRNETPQLGRSIVGLPVTYLDTDTPGPDRQHLGNGYPDRAHRAWARGRTRRLEDRSASWR